MKTRFSPARTRSVCQLEVNIHQAVKERQKRKSDAEEPETSATETETETVLRAEHTQRRSEMSFHPVCCTDTILVCCGAGGQDGSIMG